MYRVMGPIQVLMETEYFIQVMKEENLNEAAGSVDGTIDLSMPPKPENIRTGCKIFWQPDTFY